MDTRILDEFTINDKQYKEMLSCRAAETVKKYNQFIGYINNDELEMIVANKNDLRTLDVIHNSIVDELHMANDVDPEITQSDGFEIVTYDELENKYYGLSNSDLLDIIDEWFDEEKAYQLSVIKPLNNEYYNQQLEMFNKLEDKKDGLK